MPQDFSWLPAPLWPEGGIFRDSKHILESFRDQDGKMPTWETVLKWRRAWFNGSKGPFDANKLYGHLESVRSRWCPSKRGFFPNSRDSTTSATTIGDSDKTLSEQKLEEDVLLTRAKRVQEELKLLTLQGSLIRREDHERELSRMATQIKMYLLAIPAANADRLAHLEAAEIEAILHSVISDALLALSHDGSTADNAGASASSGE